MIYVWTCFVGNCESFQVYVCERGDSGGDVMGKGSTCHAFFTWRQSIITEYCQGNVVYTRWPIFALFNYFLQFFLAFLSFSMKSNSCQEVTIFFDYILLCSCRRGCETSPFRRASVTKPSSTSFSRVWPQISSNAMLHTTPTHSAIRMSNILALIFC